MFATILKQFDQGKITYEDIKAALVSTLTSSPEMHHDISAALNSETNTLLTQNQRQELLGMVYEMTQGDDDGKTRVANDPKMSGSTSEALTTSDTDTTSSDEKNTEETVIPSLATVISSTAVPDTTNKSPDHLKPGDTIKGRFVLEDLIGQGGMGMVFKARDLRKEEALDQNPHVAVKVLGASFKDHPQALIALQRESRKAQTLAHPNIVTVFDFDRDGDIAYMTMEYLEGDSLDHIIKKNYPSPFPQEQALHIIDGICNGLAYAHSHNIIHADLKPGNVYVTKNNTVKIFDFGIARAMTKKEGDKHVDTLTGETTLFDAGDLGGITPAYASYEMLTGEDPDIRDDIYALACIAYELLSGRHPFNKLPANQAHQRQLSPPPVADISRQQFRGLQRGLSFERQRRTPTVPAFQEDLCQTRSFSKPIIAASIAATIAILIIASIPVMNYIDNQEVTDIVEKLNSGDELIILSTLETLKTLDSKIRKNALEAGKESVIRYYEQKANQAANINQGKFNFEAANHLLDQAAELYADSAQLTDVRSRIQRQKNELLNTLAQRFEQHIEQENLIANPNSDDLLDTVAEIAQIDSQHKLLKDARISFAYTQAAEKAAKANNLPFAEQLIMTGLALLPKDNSLIIMRHAIEAAKADTGGSASQLAILQQTLEKTITPEQRKQTIAQLLQTPFRDRQWSKTLAAQFHTLKQKVSTDDPWLLEHNQIISNIYVTQSQKLREASRYTEANDIIGTAKEMIPANASLLSEERRVVTDKNKYDKERKKNADIARIEGAKQTLLIQAKANDVKSAKKNFNSLKKTLPAKDKFISTIAPRAIADAYLRLAQVSARRGDYRSATDLVQAGLELSPSHSMLLTSLQNYQTKIPKGGIAPTKSGDPCQANFAGHGKRGRATCNDILDNKNKGPTMIVIPAGSNISKPYAISKYEISIADYNRYCTLSKKCKVRSGKTDLPINEISYSDATQYSLWLSKTSGYNYRIPSDSEWVHAANASGKQPQKDFNCQVFLGGNLIKGLSLVSVQSGNSNGWGLINYFGNVQEWVLANSSKLKARGGSYNDPLSKCDIKLNRNHNGKPDKITGLRLVRELK